MTKEFDYHSFPNEFSSEPLDDKHFPEVAKILTKAIAEGNYNDAEAHAGYLADRRGWFDFRPIGTTDPKRYQSDDLMIQVSVRMSRRRAAELGLIELEDTLIAETKAAEVARLEDEASRLEATASAALEAANAAVENARAARDNL